MARESTCKVFVCCCCICVECFATPLHNLRPVFLVVWLGLEVSARSVLELALRSVLTPPLAARSEQDLSVAVSPS